MSVLSPLKRTLLVALCTVTTAALLVEAVRACPFCSAVSLTFSEEISNSQVALIAKLVEPPAKPSTDTPASSLDVVKAKFEVIKVLKGEKELGATKTIETVYFGDAPVGSTFLVMGIDAPTINWGTPIAISERGIEYVTKAIELPKEGVERMVFFQDHLEDKDEMLARDAYDEFAKTPYAGVIALKDHMKHDQLIEWIKSPTIPVSHRRLYLTMLGVCGKPEDTLLLEEMIRSKDRQTKGALDALVAAYLTLKGPDGMPLVEELFLKNKDAEYTDTYATIMALRFHGTEEKIIPKARLLEGIRMMLQRPQLADLVIPDLARWEDWSVMDRLVELFKNADEDSNWVRVPVINYLRACPLPQAKEKIEELAKIDPDAVNRASTLFFPLGAASTQTTTATGQPPATDKPAAAATPAPDTTPPAAKPAATSTAVTPTPTPSDKPQPAASQPAKSAATGEAVPAPLASTNNSLIYTGIGVAAVLLACAFWVILKGGQHATS